MKERMRLHVHLLYCVVVPVLALSMSCGGPSLPPLSEQKANIMNDDIRIRLVSSKAFEEAWGAAPYEDRRWTMFYVVENGTLVPQFRVPIGEHPPQWQLSVESEVGHFLGYPDRGELLGFINERLVYREKVTPEGIHAIGKAWELNARTRTMLEIGHAAGK